MILIRAAPEWDFGWLVGRAHFAPTADMRAIEAVEESTGKIAGMVGFCNWLPNSVEVHAALERPALCRGLLRAVFEYSFVESGRRILLASVASNNDRSLNLVWHLGFRLTERVKDGVAPGVDIVRHELRREHCRFIPSQERKVA